jgi:transcriptional regulator PpsR
MIDSPIASRVIASAADLALIVDREGIIVEVSLGEGFDPHPAWKNLVGKAWKDTVTLECVGKVEQLLTEARSGHTTRSREINQKAEGIGEVPLRFSGVLLDEKNETIVALGRDLRAIASMQQRMVSTQQAMDRDYGKMRQADTRYRVFFHVSSEAVLVADSVTQRVLEVNPAAATMLGESAAALQGQTLKALFEPSSWPAVQNLIAAADAGGKSSETEASIRGQVEQVMTVSGMLFRQSGSSLILLRLWSTDQNAVPATSRALRMLSMLDAMPDGFVVIGVDRRILSANAAFCELVSQANENQVVGEPLDRWLGRPGVDLNIILANLREHGTVRNFATIMRSDYGPDQEALITGVSALHGKVPCIGFTIRAVSSRLPSAVSPTTVMPRSVEQLRELVGRVPLKDLVRESADLIERLCIEAALDVSGNNRASAAQLLGLSRQGLYSKLRRHGLAEFDT